MYHILDNSDIIKVIYCAPNGCFLVLPYYGSDIMLVRKDEVCYWGHFQVLIIREIKSLNYVKVKLLEGNLRNNKIVVDANTLSSKRKCENAISLSWLGGEYD